MLHFNIKDNNGNKIQVQAPSEWNELTLGQLIEIETTEGLDVLQTFATLTGVDAAIPANSTDKKLEANIWRVIEFISKPPDWPKIIMPSIFAIGKGAYKTPLNFKEITIGQKILIAQEIKTGEDLILKIPHLLAVLFQPIIDDGEFDSKKLKLLKTELLGSNALHSYAIARFFFAKSKHLKTYGLNDSSKYQKLMTPKVKLRPDWLNKIDLSNSVTFES